MSRVIQKEQKNMYAKFKYDETFFGHNALCTPCITIVYIEKSI